MESEKAPQRTHEDTHGLRVISKLFSIAHVGACLAIAILTGLIIVQIGGRVVDAVLRVAGLPPTGFIVPSLSEIAGFLFVAATFLALASTLEKGVHIRVTLIVSKLGPKLARMLLMGALLFSAGLFGFMTWQTGLMTLDSWQFGEVSYGIIPVPLAGPQSVMTAGLGLFTLAFLVMAARVAKGLPTALDTGTDAPASSGAD